MDQRLNVHMRLMEQQLQEASARIAPLTSEMIRIDETLIKNLQNIKIVMDDQYEKYKTNKKFFSFGSFLTLLGGAGLAIVDRKNSNAWLGLGNTLHSGCAHQCQLNEAAHGQATQRTANNLIEYAHLHDDQAVKLKNAIKSFNSVVVTCKEMKVSSPQIADASGSANAFSQVSLAVKSSIELGVRGVAPGSVATIDNIMIGISFAHGILALIEAIQEIKSIDDIHPLTNTIEKFIRELLEEISELKNRT